jgi:hypothetical protein
MSPSIVDFRGCMMRPTTKTMTAESTIGTQSAAIGTTSVSLSREMCRYYNKGDSHQCPAVLIVGCRCFQGRGTGDCPPQFGGFPVSERNPGVTRRGFLGGMGAAAVGIKEADRMMTRKAKSGDPAASGISDGPASPLFTPIAIPGNSTLAALDQAGLSLELRENLRHAPTGRCVCWGIPFSVERIALVSEKAIELKWPEVDAGWIVVMHTTDMSAQQVNTDGFVPATRGRALLAERVADYVFLYSDGSQERVPILRQHQVGMMSRPWGINCFEAVAHQKPYPLRTLSEQPRPGIGWGNTQPRLDQPDAPPWVNWLWAWQNPHPDRKVAGLQIEPATGVLIVSAITAGRTSSIPLRWESRRKAILRLPEGTAFDPTLSSSGLLKHLQLDLGQVISAQPRTVYPDESWEATYNNKPPALAAHEILIEYTAHPEARFHLPDGTSIPVSRAEKTSTGPLMPIKPATQRVRLCVTDGATGKPVAVKLHVHGGAGEYLAPVDRHRIPDTFWYEDWSVDYVNPGQHFCTYIPGETLIDLPRGRVYVEISKGFEIAPIRKIVEVGPETDELQFVVERVLPWRERGWVTADTHVHFLSPHSAHLEGAGEGVNVVNLLASQWGELMTNVGDFDGRTTYGSREAGGDGEYLVRVGTENRQHVLGHISLLGYNGAIIAPMTTGGPDESALGDPVEILLTEWARQCRKQGGIVVLPHFPRPRAEHAAAIVSGEIDGVEMTSWENLYGGIDPYSLSDWYRYLNCGYFVAAVGGTDKMASTTAVGAVRTYAKLPSGTVFDYDAWKAAIRSGQTFVSYGPLMEFSVEGRPAGSRIRMSRTGGSVRVEWSVASVTIPMTRIDLIVNGEIRQSRSINERKDTGNWTVRVDRSSWIALLVRGHYADKPEIVAAHSSPVMVEVEGTEFFAAADAVTILDQIEGALAYFDTLATRAETEAYKRMRLVLTGAHRSLHNRLHQQGALHKHPFEA